MTPTRTLFTAWALLFLLGAAVVPAALVDCRAAAAEPLLEGAHCPMAAAMAAAADCCTKGEEPAGNLPARELPACCFEAPQEPAELPVVAPIQHQEAAPVLPVPALVAGAQLPREAPLWAPAAREGGLPSADLCILHASFLI